MCEKERNTELPTELHNVITNQPTAQPIDGQEGLQGSQITNNAANLELERELKEDQ